MHGCKWLLAAVLGSTRLAAVVSPAVGGEAPSAPVVADAALRSADVQAALAQVQQDASLPAEVRAKAVESYTKALEELRLADQWTAKAAAFRATAASAPRDLEALRAQLEQPGTDVASTALAEYALDRLKQGQVEAESLRSSLQNQLTELEAAVRRRGERVEEVRVLDAAVKQRLDDLDRQFSALASTGNVPVVDRAARVLLLAERAKSLAEHASYEQELPSYEATRELMRTRLDLLTRRLNQAEKNAKAWQSWADRRSREDAEAKARSARWAVITARPEVLPLAEENERLAELRKSADGPVARLKKAQDDLATIMAERQKLGTQSSHVKKVADLTDSIGLLLQKQRDELPDLRQHRKNIAARRSEITHLKLELFELETKRSDLADLDAQVKLVLSGISLPADQAERRELELTVRELLETQRDYLDALIADYNNYFNALVLDLDRNEQELIRETEQYAEYINERIFWLPSSPPLGREELARSMRAALWFADPGRCNEVLGTLAADVRKYPPLYVLAAAALAGMLFLTRRLKRRIAELGKQVASSYTDSIRPTIDVLASSAVLALTGPAVLGFIAWRLTSHWDTPELAKDIAYALEMTAMAFFTTDLFRQFWRNRGLAEAHFGWPHQSVAVMHRNLRWLMPVGLPLVFVVALVEHHEGAPHDYSLGRLAFIVGLVAVTLFALRTLRPIVAAAPAMSSQRAKLIARFRGYWYPAAIGMPLVLAAIAALGYYYTALELAWRLQATIWLVLGLVTVHSFLLRCVLVARRHLAIEHARHLREHAHAHKEAHAPGHHELHAPAAAESEAEIHLDLSAIDAQNRRLLRAGFLVTLVVGTWLIWVDVLPALKFLDEVRLWAYHDAVAQAPADPKSGVNLETRWVTAGDLVKSIVIVLLTVIAGRNVPGVLEIACLRRLPLDAGGRYAITSVTRYLITLVGAVVSLRSIGIGWANVQWLAAAMTVGLGFGLQEIFANFVSGLIILFERPMRVGDTVTICGVTGTVSRIRSRATTITDSDHRELIVPNKEFITGQLVNWTLTDPLQRMVIQVGIAYGADTALAAKLLVDVAHDHPDVLKEPAPSANFMSFGDSSLQFELRVYLAGLEKFSRVRHELNTAIDLAFRTSGIEMAFPQQDIHIRTLPVMENDGVPAWLASGFSSAKSA